MDSLDVFEVLVRENAGMLTTFLRASVSPASAADDIWQDTMVTAWRRWEDYDRSRPFGAWLRGIAAKNVLAWHRQQARQHVMCDEATLEYFSQAFSRVHHLPGDTFDDKLVALRACIEALPDGYRETIRLRYEEELMPAAVAKRTEKKTETVKKQLQRARAMLLECINRKMAEAAPV
ncbi:MAG: sigma-70 family RNA polymerase sigma factor [Planctomycetaceae bacterium]